MLPRDDPTVSEPMTANMDVLIMVCTLYFSIIIKLNTTCN
jgi:hypothetical protein